MSEPLHEPKHPKQDFQVERIAFFSDAVFAIALTLLVIEFRPPRILSSTTYKQLMEALNDLKYNAIALIVSFTIIISFWMRHHSLFKHIHNYNKPIIVTNMLLLLPIILFPFATTFIYNSINSQNTLIIIPVRIFFLVTAVASGVLYILYYLIIKKYSGYAYPMEEEEKHKFSSEMLLMTISYILVVALSFVSIKVMYFGILPLAMYNFYTRFIKKFRKKMQDRNNLKVKSDKQPDASI